MEDFRHYSRRAQTYKKKVLFAIEMDKKLTAEIPGIETSFTDAQVFNVIVLNVDNAIETMDFLVGWLKDHYEITRIGYQYVSSTYSNLDKSFEIKMPLMKGNKEHEDLQINFGVYGKDLCRLEETEVWIPPVEAVEGHTKTQLRISEECFGQLDKQYQKIGEQPCIL